MACATRQHQHAEWLLATGKAMDEDVAWQEFVAIASGMDQDELLRGQAAPSHQQIIMEEGSLSEPMSEPELIHEDELWTHL